MDHGNGNKSFPFGHVGTHTSGHDIPMPFLFPFFCLGTGVVFDALFSQSMATVFLLGISFGLTIMSLACLGKEPVSVFLYSYTWAQLDPYYIMFALLPTLIFESAFALDFQHFKHFAGQLLTFAGPGFVLAFVGMGSMMYILMYMAGEGVTWTLGYCMLYGAIVSATDPVAVVALLKALGVPHHLKVLIEGESLFNDGAAIFFHSLIHTILGFKVGLGGDVYNLAKEVSLRFIGVIMSVVIGYVFARTTMSVLGNLYDSIRERAVVVFFVYASYVAAESIRGSGVLCLVVYGISLNAGRQWMSADAYTDNKRMWGFLAYFANCIIFIITGLLTGMDMYDQVSIHILHGLVAYVLAVISRACAVIVFAALVVRRFGPYPPEYSPVLIWGGLRGALALLLALQSKGDPVFEKMDPSGGLYSTTLGFISITVVLSNMIQGVTAGPLTQKLGLGGMSSFQLHHLRAVMDWLNSHIKDSIDRKKAEKRYEKVKWSYVEKKVKVHLPLEKELAKLEDEEQDEEEEARELLQRCYEAQLWTLWHSGFLSVDVRALHNAINESTTGHRPIDVQKLYESLKASRFRIYLGLLYLRWGRMFDSAHCKWFADKPQLSDAWQMVLAAVACVQGVLSVYIYIESATRSLANILVFTNCLIVLFLAVEPLFRLWSARKRLRYIFFTRFTIWPWIDSLSVAVYLVLWIVYMTAFSFCECRDHPNTIELIQTHTASGWCKHLRTVMIFGVISLVKLPQLLFMICRFLVHVEIASVLQAKDEECLEGLNALIAMTEVVQNKLDDGTLIDDPILRRKLSAECRTVKEDADKKVTVMLKKEGGPLLMMSIQTRQVCRELLSEQLRKVEELEEQGYVGETEAERLVGAIDVCQRKVQGLHKLGRKAWHDSDDDSMKAKTARKKAVTAAKKTK